MKKSEHSTHPKEVIPARELSDNFPQAHSKLKKNHELIITKNNEILAVLVDKEAYNKKVKLIQDLVAKLEHYEIYEEVKKAKENTKTYTEDEVRKITKIHKNG